MPFTQITDQPFGGFPTFPGQRYVTCSHSHIASTMTAITFLRWRRLRDLQRSLPLPSQQDAASFMRSPSDLLILGKCEKSVSINSYPHACHFNDQPPHPGQPLMRCKSLATEGLMPFPSELRDRKRGEASPDRQAIKVSVASAAAAMGADTENGVMVAYPSSP